MKKLFISFFCFFVAALSFVEMCSAAPFTVDQRSYLHFGLSAAFGASSNAFIYNTTTNIERGQRVMLATFAGSMPGLAKELILDEYLDAGDMTFNVLGALSGAAAADFFQSDVVGWAYGDEDNVMFGMRGRF